MKKEQMVCIRQDLEVVGLRVVSVVVYLVGAVGRPFRENDQGAFGIGQDFDRGFQRLAIVPFPVQAEGTHPPDRKSFERIFVEKVPAGDRVDVLL